MKEREIIEGLMLMLEEENINCSKLVKRIGLKKYQKFEKALNAGLEVIGK